MYLLDEIDAALDLSHTQHIGQLFKTRFSGSQFIVISLKEGLFNNASVIFRARFRDGTSIVERTANANAAINAMSGTASRNVASGKSALSGMGKSKVGGQPLASRGQIMAA